MTASEKYGSTLSPNASQESHRMTTKTTAHEDVLPSPAAHAVLKALRDAKMQLDEPWLSVAHISKILRDHHGVGVHWRTVKSILLQNRSLVQRRKRNGRFEFCIMRAGEDLLADSGSEIVVIDPSNATKATVSLHALLAS